MPEHDISNDPIGARPGRAAAEGQGPVAAIGRRAPGPAATDARLRTAVEIVAGGGCEVLSLDFFDTLMWRKVPEPVNAFSLLGARLDADGLLAPDIDASAFAVLRQRAEQRARQARELDGRGEEVTLREICAFIPQAVLRDITLDGLVDREVELERSLLVPDLDVVELVRLAGEHDVRTVCVSDTYFGEGHLRSFLGSGPAASLEIERVFASSAHGVGKEGGLWRIVLDDLGVKPAKVIHVGDNHEADVAAAGRAGVRGIYFERRPDGLARVVHREALHATAPLSPYHGDYGLTALRSKVLHRVEAESQPPELKAFWSFGAASIGPPLAGFADWVQERAGEAGVSRVFCMMREGKIVSELVNAAAASVSAPVDARPIWLSRQVCARASIVDGSAEELGRLFQRRRMPTVAEFCATLGVDCAELRDFADMAGARLHQPALAAQLVERLASDMELRGRIVASSGELRSRLVRYVESVRPPGEKRIVLVDLGWGATIQTLLDGLLREAGSEVKTTGLYLMTTGRAADRMLDGADVHGYLANAGQPEAPVEAFMRSPEILEQICMPDHGSQVDLDSSLEPVLEAADSEPFQSAQRESVQKGVKSFQREWLRYRTCAPEALVALHEHGQDRLRSILVRSLTAPTTDEAALFAGWLHDENFGSQGQEALVPPMSARAARYLEPRVVMTTSMAELYWPFGLAALHNQHLARAVEAATSGVVPWDAFSSALETGDVEIYCDRGWGFRRQGMVTVPGRRNRLGLTYANGTVVGDIVRRVRIDPAKLPCVVRIDFIRLRCSPRGTGDTVTLDFDTPERLEQITTSGMRSIGPSSYIVRGFDPNVVIDLNSFLPREVHTVDVECGLAVLPLPRSALGAIATLQEQLRERAKRSALGAPARLAYALMRRLE